MVVVLGDVVVVVVVVLVVVVLVVVVMVVVVVVVVLAVVGKGTAMYGVVYETLFGCCVRSCVWCIWVGCFH